MKQQCSLWAVWLTWLAFPVAAVLVTFSLGPPAAVFVLAVGVLAQVAYVRWFPHLSAALGYGSVALLLATGASPEVLEPSGRRLDDHARDAQLRWESCRVGGRAVADAYRVGDRIG